MRNADGIPGLLCILVVLALVSGLQGATFEFAQWDWLDGSGGFANPMSDWGEVGLTFSPADLFPATDGSHYGYVNIVTNVAGGSSNNWAVENLFVRFPSSLAFEDQAPDRVNFSLGVVPGATRVSSLTYTEFITPSPLDLLPLGVFQSATVRVQQVLFGGNTDPSDQYGNWLNLATTPAFNFVGLPVGDANAVKSGGISITDGNVAKVDEGRNGCGPGSAARSLAYLGLTTSPQTAYGILADANHMKLDPNIGTTWSNYKAGKDAFHDPNLVTTWKTDPNQVIQDLQKGADVEMWVGWGRTVANDANTDRGGHVAFVSEVKELRDANGVLTGYKITYFDDLTQGDGVAAADKHDLVVNANGTLQGYGATSKMWGYYVETLVPEPATLVLLAAGAGLGLARRRRARRG